MQDIHRLRGLSRCLTSLEKAMFVAALSEHMEREFTPKETNG